jgi:acyl-CoA synthetase (AMP-forming)/AMP-acid ligase II
MNTVVRVAEALENHSRATPQACAVVDVANNRRATYEQLAADVRSLAEALRTRGDLSGKVASVQLPNSYDAVVVDLAVLTVGGVVNPLLTNYRHAELSNVIRTADPAVIFTPRLHRGHEYGPMIDAVIEETGSSLAHLVVEPGHSIELPGTLGGGARVLPAPDDGAGQEVEPISELIFTSGTQAAPKAVLHTERTTSTNAYALAEHLGLTNLDVVWVPSPIGHSTGLNFGVRASILLGATMVLEDIWNGSEAAEIVERERCSYTLAAVTFLRDLLDAAKTKGNDVGSLRAFACGGAPVPAFMVDEADALGVNVLRLYGSTEALVMSCHQPGAPIERRRATDGPPLPGVEIQTVSDDGELRASGEAGEIVTRGNNVCAGLLVGDRASLPPRDGDGWMRTEDVGIVDEFGELQVVGRKKEIIIRGGMNISAREVEEAILHLPGISDVAVVGIPDPRLGEHACAFVAVEPDAGPMTLRVLTDGLRAAGLAPYKLPEQIEIVDTLPRTPTGKVQKFLLRARIESPGSAGGDPVSASQPGRASA